jgi:pantoate--beta-alanine ligase
MGKKDFQQYFLVKKILGKKYKITIIGCPIIRDKNKIALSTRNKLLNKDSKIIASSIAKELLNFKRKLDLKRLKMPINLLKLKSNFEKNHKVKVDYLELRDEKDLKLKSFKSKSRLFIAYTVHKVRLIDNF